MRASLFVSAMMVAAVTAVPALKVYEETVTVTVKLHKGQHAPTPAPKPAPKPVPAPKPAPKKGGGYLESDHPKPESGSGSSSYPTDSGNDMLDVANKWRAKYGLPEYTWDESMIPNCEKTGSDGNGIDEVHQMIPNKAMGQVITPGQQIPNGDLKGMSPFEVAYVAWLCEVNTDGPLQPSENDGCDVCAVVQDTLTMAYGGETGHHKILTDPSYTKIACAFTPKYNTEADASEKYQGLYVCDVAQ